MIHWLAGIHAVNSALRNDAHRVKEVLIEQGSNNPRLKKLIAEVKEFGIPIHQRTREAMDRAGGGLRHQGVLAMYEAPEAMGESDLPQLLEVVNQDTLWLILDGVQDPHNLGACLRSAEAAGVTAVITPKDRAVGLTPAVQKASAGAATRIALVQVTNLARSMEMIRHAGIWVTGLTQDAPKSLYEIDLTGPSAIVLGNEEDGLRRLTQEKCDYLAQIPMYGQTESLNVSVAAGIALFEVRRQRL